MTMSEEAGWRIAHSMAASAETMKRAAEANEEAVRRLEALIGDGYGGNGLRLLEALEAAAQPTSVPEAVEHLKALTNALNGAFISSWQSTARWQKELDAATEWLAKTGNNA